MDSVVDPAQHQGKAECTKLCKRCKILTAYFYDNTTKLPKSYDYKNLKDLRELGRKCGLCAILSSLIDDGNPSQKKLKERCRAKITVFPHRRNGGSLYLIFLQHCELEKDENYPHVPLLFLGNFIIRPEKDPEEASPRSNGNNGPTTSKANNFERHRSRRGWESYLPTFQSWMKECTEEHHICNAHDRHPGTSRLPKRVLDIGVSGEAETIRLIDSNGSTGKYAALSHRWPDPKMNPKMMRATTNNLDSLRAGFPLINLPKTFCDAVRLARMLSIPYLWVDSLCIVQDDSNDWKDQASAMSSIYQNAFVTFAASSAQDSFEGLTDPGADLHRIMWDEKIGYVEVHNERHYEDVLQTSLNNRAWVLQEWILSPRTIHFARNALYWECSSLMASSDKGMNRYMLFDEQYEAREKSLEHSEPFSCQGRAAIRGSLHTWGLIYDTWYRLIEEYSRRSLTFSKDKFAAFAGLTSALKDRINDIPIAGLWRADLHFGLLWSAQSAAYYHQVWESPHWVLEHNKPTWKDALPGIPSWSWASLNGPVYFNVSRRATKFVHELEIINIQLDGVEDYVDSQTLGGSQTQGSSQKLPGHILARGILRPMGNKQGFNECDRYIDKSCVTWVDKDGNVIQDGNPSSDFARYERITHEIAPHHHGSTTHRDLESMLGFPPKVAESYASYFPDRFEYFTFEKGESKPLERVHGRVILDRPMQRDYCDHSFFVLLVTTELKPAKDSSKGLVPYLHHVLVLQSVEGMRLGQFYKRIGVGHIRAEFGYFDGRESHDVYIL